MKEICRVCGGSNIALFCTAFDRVLGNRHEVWQIQQCRGCGFGWTFPQLSAAQIPDHYPPTYLGNVEKTVAQFRSGRLRGSRSWRGETEKVRLVERYVPGGAILDVGCGDGKFLWALDGKRWSRTGVDFSRETLAVVASRIKDLRLIPGSINSEELKEASFDAITFWHALEHLPEPEQALSRAAWLLKPGGWIFLSLPNIDSLQARLFRQYWYPFGDVPRHLYHFSRQSLEILLKRSGFQFRKRLLFSPLVNFHSLKLSLRYWAGQGLAYYCFKPALLLFPPLERLTGKPGIVTVIAQKFPVRGSRFADTETTR